MSRATLYKENFQILQSIVDKNYTFSELNFTRMSSPTDDMPLMPSYGDYKNRLKSFVTLKDSLPKEVEELARMGFYNPCIEKTCWTKFHQEEKLNVALCYCCGSEVFVYREFPRRLPVRHHLHCLIFTPPEDKKLILNTIKPVNDQPLTWDMLDAARKVCCPERKFENEDRTKPVGVPRKCGGCKANLVEVTGYPCYHFSCISCAKEKKACWYCNISYFGLKRTYNVLTLN